MPFLFYYRDFGLYGIVEGVGRQSFIHSLILWGFEGNMNTAGNKTDENPYPQGAYLFIKGENNKRFVIRQE